MRIILDANLIIAAFATHGICHLILESCLSNHEVFLSDPILGEVTGKLERKIKLPPALVAEIKDYLRAQTTLHNPLPPEAPICRDPDDDPILCLAEEVAAHYLVSGDKDLLELGSHGVTSIVTPRRFADILREEPAERAG